MSDALNEPEMLAAPRRVKDWVRVSLDISPELNSKLEELAGENHASKSDVLRRAIALMDIATQAKKSGKKFGIAEANQPLATEIIGL